MEEIIIDGVDVSSCKYYHYKGCSATGLRCENCTCYYKQLKRLEQENEELKEEYQQAHEDFICSDTCLRIANTEKDELKKYLLNIAMIIEELEQQYDDIKDFAEIKEIKEIITEAIGE